MSGLLGRLARLVGVVLGASPGAASALPQDDISCAIDLSLTDGHAQIRGVAMGKAGSQATYRLVVRKSGDTGTSNLSQGGQIVIAPTGRAMAGSVDLSIEGGATYEAVLSLNVDGVVRECRAAGRADMKL
ncbi:curli-like amyloid fiber formation chaperone CsgH [Methylobacterium sp. NFXW15]|uniref:curli-like amyloid fiber formation chaperone CsgH n=1 Tax=Methylobacterium sp. NFXW15 TaxID=2819512 RepID=UPI003CF16C60